MIEQKVRDELEIKNLYVAIRKETEANLKLVIFENLQNKLKTYTKKYGEKYENK